MLTAASSENSGRKLSACFCSYEKAGVLVQYLSQQQPFQQLRKSLRTFRIFILFQVFCQNVACQGPGHSKAARCDVMLVSWKFMVISVAIHNATNFRLVFHLLLLGWVNSRVNVS
jgi:hypothetical protein